MAMPIIVTTSPKIATTPEVSASLSASMSFVSRVISAPTGCRSKKRRPMRCKWLNSSMRRSCMARWPVRLRR